MSAARQVPPTDWFALIGALCFGLMFLGLAVEGSLRDAQAHAPKPVAVSCTTDEECEQMTGEPIDLSPVPGSN